MFKSLKVGESLENPAFWKKVQLYITIIGTALPVGALAFPALQAAIDKDVLSQTLAAVAAVNVYLTAATTDKIGLR